MTHTSRSRCAALLLALAGCTACGAEGAEPDRKSASEEFGTIELRLLSDKPELRSLRFSISRESEPQSEVAGGTANLSSLAAAVSVELAPGNYVVTLTTEDDPKCLAAGPVTVRANRTARTSLTMVCGQLGPATKTRMGPDGDYAEASCRVDALAATALSEARLLLTSITSGSRELTWRVSPDSAGTFEDATAPATVFYCTSAVQAVISLMIDDGECRDQKTAPISCVGLCGNGVAESGEDCDSCRLDALAAGLTCPSL